MLRNEGPILVDLDARGARVRQALLRGKNADLTISGSVGFGGKNPWDLRVRAGANLALLQDLDPAAIVGRGAGELRRESGRRR